MKTNYTKKTIKIELLTQLVQETWEVHASAEARRGTVETIMLENTFAHSTIRGELIIVL